MRPVMNAEAMADEKPKFNRITVDPDDEDFAALEAVASHEKLNKSDTLRRLIRAEARRIAPEQQATAASA